MKKVNHTYTLLHPDLVQPKDRSDELYRLLDEFIIDGDEKQIALDFGINSSVVSDVKKGRCRSRRVWDQLIDIMLRRSQAKKNLLAYMSFPLPQKAA
jgi:hypothetical protein